MKTTMSYVPPHLRNSSSSTTTTNSKTLDSDCSTKLSYTSKNNSSFPSCDAFRRSSGNLSSSTSRPLSVPESIFPDWMPSDRVLRMKPEQVRMSMLYFFVFSISYFVILFFRNFDKLHRTTNMREETREERMEWKKNQFIDILL